MKKKIARDCPNCGAPVTHKLAIYCHSHCSRVAEIIRHARRRIDEGGYFGSKAAEAIGWRRDKLAAQDRHFAGRADAVEGAGESVTRAPTSQGREDFISDFNRRVLSAAPLKVCDDPEWRRVWRGYR